MAGVVLTMAQPAMWGRNAKFRSQQVQKTKEVVNLRTTMGDNHVGVAWTRHTALVICKPMARVYGLDAALPHMNVCLLHNTMRAGLLG